MTNTELPDYSNGVTVTFEELLPYKQRSIAWLPPAKSLWSTLIGQHQSKQLGRGMDFSEVRQYQPGDDIRAIDWRVTARMGKPHTKLFAEEREKPVILYIDLSASMQFGSKLLLKSVQAAHIASLIAWLSLSQKDRIGALLDLGHRFIEIRPKGHQQGVLTVIQKLVEQQNTSLTQRTTPATNKEFAHTLTALNRLSPKGSEIVIISDFTRYSEAQETLFSQLRRHNTVRLIHIIDPLEQGNTAFRGMENVSDNKQTVWLDFSAKSTRNGIKNSFESHKDKLLLMCQNLGIFYTALSSDTTLLNQLTGK